MGKKLLLGVAGSPRKGANSDILLHNALEAAEEGGAVETRAVYLREHAIAPCKCCYFCCTEAAGKNGGERACVMRDGMDDIYPLLLACDGLIISAPVFFGSLNAQTKAFMDRTEGLLRYGASKYQNGLRNKVLGGIAMGGNRNGGQEFTLQQIHYFGFVQDMIVVGSGPDRTPGCYLGGCGTTWPQKGEVRDAVLQDELAMKNSAMLGRRVAEMIEKLA
jgi:multimeric flavodoxin WrbA